MKPLLTVLALGLSLTVASKADMVVGLSSVSPAGPNFNWNYTIAVQSDSRLDPAATNGSTCLDSPCTPPGTFLTIYDFAGMISVLAPPSGWSFTTQNAGLDPQQTMPSDTIVVNVTFYYNGPVITGEPSGLYIPGFTIVSSLDMANAVLHNYTSQSTSDSGSSSGLTVQHLGVVSTPGIVPEPATATLIAFGLVALACLGRSRRQSD